VISLPFSRPEVLVPPSMIPWMISRAERLLSPVPIQDEITGVRHVFLDPSVEGDFAVYNVIRKNLTSNLPRLIPVIMEELAARIDESWGFGTEWHEETAMHLARSVISRVSCRVILSEPLCTFHERRRMIHNTDMDRP
jgi:hypothetical protein